MALQRRQFAARWRLGAAAWNDGRGDPARSDARGVDAAAAATLQLLDGANQPSAILAGQNLITIGAIRALSARAPAAELVGFDDFLLADLLGPPVTVVAQDAAALGRAAAELLFARLDGDSAPARHVIVPTRLVPRGSGEIELG